MGEAEVVKTSIDLGWRRLDAKVYRFRPGEYTWRDTESHRIFVHLAGRARLRLRGGAPGEAREAKSGLIWISPAGHANAGLEVVDGIAEMLQLLAPAETTCETCPKRYGLTLESLTVVGRDGFSDPVLEALARSILAEMETPSPAGPLYADTVACTLSAYILRRCAQPTDPPQPLESSPIFVNGKLADPRLERSLRYIEHNLEHELSLETLAREATLSLYHFARAFKVATGHAPHRFVLQRRIERARDLLRDAEIPIATVALRCGFASQAHLTHVFRRITGSTPGAYRALVQRSTDSL
jgi:AraC family transcriptional regulator